MYGKLNVASSGFYQQNIVILKIILSMFILATIQENVLNWTFNTYSRSACIYMYNDQIKLLTARQFRVYCWKNAFDINYNVGYIRWHTLKDSTILLCLNTWKCSDRSSESNSD